METFWRQGYHHTSIQDLVQAMGINRASLYDTFTDKHTLYLAALSQYSLLQTNDIAETVSAAHTAKTKVRAIFDRITYDLHEDTERKGCFLTNASLEMLPHYPDVQALLLANAEALQITLYQLLTTGLATGELPPALNPATVVPYLASQLVGLRVLAKTQPNVATAQAITDLVMSVLE